MTHHIGLVVTGAEALYDFQIFVSTLEKWEQDIVLYVATDDKTNISSIKHKCTINTKISMNAYTGKTRKIMEKTKGVIYDNLFKDFTYEKANVLRWMFEVQPSLKNTGAWLMDSDILHLGKLPTIPSSATLALSPHFVNIQDENLYGHYNAGMLWLKDVSLLDVWTKAGFTSRFYEQASLEEVAKAAQNTLYEFPVQVNYGWWRLYQGLSPSRELRSKFTVMDDPTSIGICYEGKPITSMHTHSRDRTPGANGYFNIWLTSWIHQFPDNVKVNEWKTMVFG